jgi:hypothetical protein
MIEAVSTSETSSVSTRLHDATSKKTVIFLLAAPQKLECHDSFRYPERRRTVVNIDCRQFIHFSGCFHRYLHQQHYSPSWTLSSITTVLHLTLSRAFNFQFLIPSCCKSCSASSKPSPFCLQNHLRHPATMQSFSMAQPF